MENYGRFYEVFRRVPSQGDRVELKELIVGQFTGGRTVHLHEMKEPEYMEMCRSLERTFPDWQREKMQESLRKKRSMVLSLMQKAGIDTSDWDKVNAFCRNKKIAGKNFRELKAEELDVLGKKMRMIAKKGGLKSSENSQNVMHYYVINNQQNQ